MVFERPLRWLLMGGIFAIPLLVFVVSPSTYYPYVAGRAFSFRLIVEAAVPVAAIILAVRPASRPHATSILVAFAAFVVFLGLCDLLGANIDRSLWGAYERMDGWILLSHLFALFVLMAAFLRTERVWLAFWCVSIFTSLAVCGLTYGQALGIFIDHSTAQGRFSGSFGNAGYLGIYMLLNVFLTALAAVQASRSFPAARHAILIMAALTMAAQITALLISGTRAALLGLVGGLAVSAVMGALQLGTSRAGLSRRRLSAILVGVVVLICGLAFAMSYLPVLGRIAAVSTSQPEIQLRLLGWRIAWNGFLENPLLGWGQENFRYVLQRFYEPALYGSGFPLDRPHNIVFEWLLAGGIVALLLYLTIFLATAVSLFRSERFRPSERSILAGFLAAYLGCNLFMFDNLASYLIFVAVLGFVHWRMTSDRGSEAVLSPRRYSTPWLAGGTAIVVFAASAYAVVENARALMANVALNRAMTGPAFLAPGAYAQALAFNSFGTEDIRRRLIRAALTSIGDAGTASGVRDQLVAMAHREVDRQIADDPDYYLNHLQAGALLNASKDFVRALPYLKRANVLAPFSQEVLVTLGQNARGRMAETEATDYFCKAYDLDRSKVSLESDCLNRR